MNKFFLLMWLFFPLAVFSAPEDALLSKHNQKILTPIQITLQSSSVVITGQDRISIGYGCLVSESGHIITKASLVEDLSEIYIRLDKKEYTATIENTSEEWDIALLKIEGKKHTKLRFNSNPTTYGDIVISNGVTSLLTRRLKFGVISAKGRAIPIQEARLDLLAISKKNKSYIITELKPNGVAEKAGLLKGDEIHTLDHTPITDFTTAFHTHLHGKWPGKTVTLGVKREGEELEFTVKLLWLHELSKGPQDRNEAMSGRISTRRTGFPMVIQHDIPLSSRTIGGPLLNLKGGCVGMNIARYSRAETYAIPASAILNLLEKWNVPQ